MRTTNTLLTTIAALALATTPAAIAANPTDIQPQGIIVPTTGVVDLAGLAHAFGEVPGSTRSDTFDSSASCGSSGHCNLVGCPDPGCPSGKTPAYQCTVTTIMCEDTHDWYNPFDNDEHNMYDCSSSCVSEPPSNPPPPECLVRNPIGTNCLIEKPDDCGINTPATVNARLDGLLVPVLAMKLNDGGDVTLPGGPNC